MRCRARMIAGVIGMLGLVAGPGAGPALACISESPSFTQAVTGAEVIARVTIMDGTDYEQPGDVEVFRVDRVLKGRPGPRIELVEPVTYLCGDRVGYLTGGADGGVGQSIILATNVDFFDEVIHPFWIVVDGGLSGTAGWPPAAKDLADVEAAILQALDVPDTSTAPHDDRGATSGSPTLPAVIVAAAALVSAVMIRRRFPARHG